MLLPPEERETIISHGAALRFSSLRKRLFLAESKVRFFEQKYAATLSELDAHGLPDDAGHEMHEDYVMWHHWDAVATRVRKGIASLGELAHEGLFLPTGDLLDARH